MAKSEYVPPTPKCWEYELEEGFRVMAGKTDADNDLLILRVAEANDYWFHVKGMPGSHVILLTGGNDPSKQTLNQAASIAAYHSKARGGGTVAVNMTLAKYVTKPRGAKPGRS